MEDVDHNNQDPFTEDAEEEIPWPKKGDTLFATGGDRRFSAYVGYRSEWFPYIEGYKLAADVLVESLAEDRIRKHRSDADFVVYPIVFLYRQFLELSLKQIILDGDELCGRERKLPGRHELEPLWTRCKDILKKIGARGSDSEIAAIDKCIKQFSKNDDGSYSFRYPVNTGNKPSLPKKLNNIDIKCLADTMDGIAFWLDCAHTEIHERIRNLCSGF
ncbi:MAG: hypothetical protein Q7T82_09060 [Armatimonadota bacterium]|nr:hypothetical protein [Armatimonadota bacterium]